MTAIINPDKYYTPKSVARRALEYADLKKPPLVCADTACGSGNLLRAAEDVLSARHCLGIDNDANIIRKLRLERPNWQLHVGDFLKRNNAPVTNFPNAPTGVDLLVLNPPFSLGAKKHIVTKYLGTPIKCSVAMAHILRGLELFKPNNGAIAVVPESLLFSNTDQHARILLAQSFSFTQLLQLNPSTFKGANVNSSFIQIKSQNIRPALTVKARMYRDVIPTIVVRGGLQMHTFKHIASGVPVVHSTSLTPIARYGISTIANRTSIKVKGRVSGWMLLLPRVGTPKKDAFRAFYSQDEVQLSDCVIGMLFSSKEIASLAERRILSHWNCLVDLYRGTGARYIIIKRLVNWLYSIGLKNQV